MNRRNAVVLAGITSLLAGGVTQAGASVYYVTYTGTASGTDTSGLFGAAGSVLRNVAFTSYYSYDPTLFGTARIFNTSATSQAYGGQEFSITDPLISAAITINGSTYNQDTSYYGIQELQASQNIVSTGGCSLSNNNNCLFDTGSALSSPILSLTALQSLSINYAVYGADGNLVYNGEDISLTDTYVRITNVAPYGFPPPPSPPPTSVPEPGTNALLAGAALSFIGLVGCRRRAERTGRA